MSSIYSPRTKCGVCADVSILHSHCKQCGNLCENCSGLHSKGNAFKDHEVISLTFSPGMETSSIKKEPSIQPDLVESTTATSTTPVDPASTSSNASNPPKKKGMKRKSAQDSMKGMEKAACPKHKYNTVDLCCQDCNQAICSQCMATAHTGHRTGDFTEFFEHKRAMLRNDLYLIQSHIKQREEAKQQLVEHLEKMEQATENVVKEVKDFIEKMRATILQKAEDLKTRTKETKRQITSRKGEFVKEINKLETLRKKCQDELDTKDSGVVLFRKDVAPSLENYKTLPSSYKITPPAFIPAALEKDIINSFGTIVSAIIEEETIAFKPSSVPVKMPGKKKKKGDNSTPLPVSTASSATAQDHEILQDAVKSIYHELGKHINKK
ncbi:B-box type zinc finger protein ncl-1-like [Saccostrea echinata]|uniref:B-box type zinc finger protein ncl-1-like n=1 Tax=Saccostrea echinata TaxID=191078 RepID=UPI002A836C44|nr:B-box type zinc finger protein ncl-1-like [Saccostrea echinata]XP_061186739.1 B-box type zinc finger protein ncl-1-like [Saccostrea echinata]XP_061186740.1 B-box type zinc finger protein ncl-1-like [Saccostrea echinata]XP_061186741.1 B-box type zinc finger protein ncl-1-like [Saccostrea echinata]